MISQPAVHSTGAPMASGSVPDQPTENDGLFAGFLKVVVWGGPILFLRSLHPGYIPPGTEPSAQSDEGPAFTFGSPDGQDSSFFQGVELAARLVSPHTVLPAEIRTMLEGIVTFSAATRFRDLLGAFGATKGSPPTESQADISVDSSPTNDKGRKKRKPQQTRQRTSPPANASIGTVQLTKTAVALGTLSSLTAAAAASPSSSKTEEPIDVPDADTLNKIGRDRAHPLNGTYRQTADIHVTGSFRSIGGKTGSFTGDYNGDKYEISGLKRCLVQNLEGKVRRLNFKDAYISTKYETASTGVAACKMSGKAEIRNIKVKSSVLTTSGDQASAGIAVGEVDGGKVIGTTAENCNVTTSGSSAYAGIGAGYVYKKDGEVKNTIRNTIAKNCNVTTSSSDAGIGAGRVKKGDVFETTATDCKVETSGGNAGIGAGRVDVKEKVDRTTAVKCNVKNSGSSGNAGIGVGFGKATDTKAMNCGITTTGNENNAGIGVGDGEATNTLAIECKVENNGTNGNIGIGVGKGYAKDTTAMNCEVKNSGPGLSTAGIGAGMGAADNTIAINCTVETSGGSGFSGIGAGRVASHKTHYSTVANTKSFNSTVKSSASGFAGFGVGLGSSHVFNTMAVYSTVEGKRPLNNIGAGSNPTFCYVTVNHKQPENKRARWAKDCPWQLDNFCEDIEPSFVKPNCQPTHCYSSALSSDTVSGAFIEYCPEPKTNPTTTSTHIPTTRPTPPTVVPATPAPVATASNTTMNCSDLPATTTALTPAPVATASNTTINVSGLPGTTMALPTSAAPLAATLSTGAIAGIALGASALVAAGVCIYRHCQRSSSPAAADDDGLLELVTVDTAGQAEELGAQPTIKTYRKEAREEPVGEQRSSIQSPKPPRLKQRALPATPILAGKPFPEKLGEQVIPQHESLYGNVYEDIDTCNPRRMRTAVEPDY